jgi:hypothetical protein
LSLAGIAEIGEKGSIRPEIARKRFQTIGEGLRIPHG